MIRKILVWLGLVCLIGSVSVWAGEVPHSIRVGLIGNYRNIGSFSIGNQQVFVGFDSNGIFQKAAVLQASSAMTAKTASSYFVRLPQSFLDYDAAKMACQNYETLGYHATVGLQDFGMFYVYLENFKTMANAEEARAALSGYLVSPSARKIVLSDQQGTLLVFDNDSKALQICATDGILSVGQRKYRGAIELAAGSGGMTLVNVLSVDDYLYSVVASEMPSSWHKEALKAQAVAARSYLVTQMGVHSVEGFQICDQVHCQNYLGAGNESENSIRAVLETAGVMAYYGGAPINAVYFSSSGGYTENSEDVWVNSLPYLKAVSDGYESGYKEWNRSFTLSELTALLTQKNISIGQAVGVSIQKTSGDGRVQELVIRGTSGSKVLYKDEIRTFFSGSKEGSLPSKNFMIGNGISSTAYTLLPIMGEDSSSQLKLADVVAVSSSAEGMPIMEVTVLGNNSDAVYREQTTTVVSNAASSGDVVLSGKGWGHGVGMSQFGAKGLAEAGRSFVEILKYYYTGIEVR